MQWPRRGALAPAQRGGPHDTPVRPLQFSQVGKGASSGADAAVGDAREAGNVFLPGHEIVGHEFAQMRMPAGARHDLHQLDARLEEVGEPPGRLLDLDPRGEMRLLRRDADRAVVGVAGAHAEAADRLDRRVGDRDRIGAERQRLGEVGGLAQAAGDDQRHVAPLRPVEMAACPRQRRDGGHRDVVAEDERRRPRAAAAAIQDDVVDAHRQRRVDILLDVLGRELVADGDATGVAANLVGEVPDLAPVVPIGEARRRDRGRALGETPHLGDLALHLVARQMPAGAGLGALPALEVECLHMLELVPGKAEAARGELVKVAAAGLLLLRQHAALARADAGAGELGPARQRDLGGLGERAEAHVGDQERNIEGEPLLRARPDHHLGADGCVVEMRHAVELCGDELNVVPARQVLARHAHGDDDAVMAGLGKAVPGIALNEADMRFLGRRVRVGVEAEIVVPLEGLRVVLLPGADLVGIDQDLAVLHPRGELGQHLRVIVLADAGIESVVPVVHAADQVLAVDMAVGHERAPVQAAAIEDGDLVVVAHDAEVDVADQRVGRLAVRQLVERLDGNFVHRLVPSATARLAPRLNRPSRPFVGSGRLALAQQALGIGGDDVGHAEQGEGAHDAGEDTEAGDQRAANLLLHLQIDPVGGVAEAGGHDRAEDDPGDLLHRSEHPGLVDVDLEDEEVVEALDLAFELHQDRHIVAEAVGERPAVLVRHQQEGLAGDCAFVFRHENRRRAGGDAEVGAGLVRQPVAGAHGAQMALAVANLADQPPAAEGFGRRRGERRRRLPFGRFRRLQRVPALDLQHVDVAALEEKTLHVHDLAVELAAAARDAALAGDGEHDRAGLGIVRVRAHAQDRIGFLKQHAAHLLSAEVAGEAAGAGVVRVGAEREREPRHAAHHRGGNHHQEDRERARHAVQIADEEAGVAYAACHVTPPSRVPARHRCRARSAADRGGSACRRA